MKNIVILGGGTAGWICASGLARALLKNGTQEFSITLVESSEIGTIGVGEATIPSIIEFIDFLNIDQNDFIKNTDATYKLGIEFLDWKSIGHSYFHPFGSLGPEIDNKPLFQHWMRQKLDRANLELMDLSIAAKLAKNNAFIEFDKIHPLIAQNIGYALHFDAGLVAKYLKSYSIHLGVKNLNAKVKGFQRNKNGDLSALIFEDNKSLEGDFFIDCSGFGSLILGRELGIEFEDWSKYLLCDSAYAVQTELNGDAPPYTKSMARTAGWTWQIPLRSRMGNGYVFSSQFESDKHALDVLLNSLSGATINEPRKISFKAGVRKKSWHKNCLALGLSSGFLEPLESTSIHLVISSLFRFLEYFPHDGDCEIMQTKFNEKAHSELCEIRDFLILHYCQTAREDTQFWQYCKNMDIPDTLKAKIELFTETGKITSDFYDLFKPVSWASVLIGMNTKFKRADPLISAIKPDVSHKLLENYSTLIDENVKVAPKHKEILRKFENYA